MSKYQRWIAVEPTKKEIDILEDRGSGYASRNGKDICLITQVNDDCIWAIEHRSGDIVTADTRGDGIDKAAELAEKFDIAILPNDLGDYQTFEMGCNKSNSTKFLRALSRI